MSINQCHGALNLEKTYHNARSGPLLKKLDGGDAHAEYCEDSLNGAEDQSGVHGCQIWYGTMRRVGTRLISFPQVNGYVTQVRIRSKSFHPLLMIARVI
jgi:hypothetical protein